MSAWLVDNDCINRIIAGIEQLILNNSYEQDKLEKVINKDGWHGLGQNWQGKLGKSMFKMNLEALSQRYGKKSAKPQAWRTDEHPDGYTYKYNPRPSKNTALQRIKSTQCYLYQSGEGDVHKSKLYKYISDVEGRLMSQYINKLPEYDQARWG